MVKDINYLHKKNRELAYFEALDFIKNAAQLTTPHTDSPERQGIVMGLDTMREYMDRLGNPQNSLRIIYIAGTNGKGSTNAFISTILAEAGYKVGRYTSPAVNEYREIIQKLEGKREGGREKEGVRVECISEQEVVNAIRILSGVAEDMQEAGLSHPTPFELETAMAFITFRDWKCDFAVLEAGMGARSDATNVVQNVECSVLTVVDVDHTHFLGRNLASVAFEKAGVIRSKTPLVTTLQKPEVMTVIEEECKRWKAPLVMVNGNIPIKHMDTDGTQFLYPFERETTFHISLLGRRQVENAALAINVISILQNKGYEIHEEAIRNALNDTVWSGRFEIIRKEPWVVIDGAHNPNAVKSLKENLKDYFEGMKRIGVMGVFADKDYHTMVAGLKGVFDAIYTITPDSNRALSGRELAKVVEGCDIPSQVFDSMEAAIGHAMGEAEKGDKKKTVVVCFGSLSIIGKVKGMVVEK